MNSGFLGLTGGDRAVTAKMCPRVSWAVGELDPEKFVKQKFCQEFKEWQSFLPCQKPDYGQRSQASKKKKKAHCILKKEEEETEEHGALEYLKGGCREGHRVDSIWSTGKISWSVPDWEVRKKAIPIKKIDFPV